ncbi:unnamed protein product [Ambrosiozyma monospora]|uniref:Unnamed protein product n=1 Tax=Ambrosiozyma monospora TaxID=43982 RepID=A0A9W6Z745_AMBMO|nr:unnamed protein product [Ambrosiozyma monospora]
MNNLSSYNQDTSQQQHLLMSSFENADDISTKIQDPDDDDDNNSITSSNDNFVSPMSSLADDRLTRSAIHNGNNLPFPYSSSSASTQMLSLQDDGITARLENGVNQLDSSNSNIQHDIVNNNNNNDDVDNNNNSSIPTNDNDNDNTNSLQQMGAATTTSNGFYHRFQNQARYTWFNAPLLRFFHRDNRYAVLSNDPNSPQPPQIQGPGGPTATPGRRRIIGETNDGVFSNMSAKPTVRTAAELAESQGRLPTYEEAASDPTPPYWEAAIMAGYDDEIFVDGLPVGNILNFFWNMMVSISFQFVGFIITYLLHTSHAAKNGSQAGLGFTLISYGLTALPLGSYTGVKGDGDNGINENKFEPDMANAIDVDHSQILDGSINDYSSGLNAGGVNGGDNDSDGGSHGSDGDGSFTDSPFFSYSLIALGVFIILKALIDYFRAKRKEKQLLNPPVGPPVVV